LNGAKRLNGLNDLNRFHSKAKLVFHLVNKRQASDRDRFRPAIIAPRQAVLQSLLNPLPVCSLKISQIRKPA
jgi:hypothetical protein